MVTATVTHTSPTAEKGFGSGERLLPTIEYARSNELRVVEITELERVNASRVKLSN